MKITQRQLESLFPLFEFTARKGAKYDKLILTASSDTGVMRNNGRNGAKFAPKALINALSRFNNHFELQDNEKVLIQETWRENESFEKNQLQSANLISDQMLQHNPRKTLHLGGGHDHIYPLLMAVEQTKKYKHLLIINFDAHCDTRVDSISHSGTPFRDYDDNGSLNFHLIQLGIHEYANSKSTLSPLKRAQEEVIFFNTDYDQMRTRLEQSLAQLPFELDENCAIILSLDCDGISGSEMPAVSCVNSLGLPGGFVLDTITSMKTKASDLFFGVYEFNPVYDTPSFQGRRLISHLMYEFLK